MIKIIEWFLPHRAAELENENTAAVEDLQVSRALHDRAKRLAADGFTDGYTQAFYADDRRRRKA